MKRCAKFYFIGILALLITGGALWWIMPVKTFSAMENRYLNSWPVITISGIRSGNVQEQFVNTANDQFVFRDKWMKAATELQRLLGIHDLNGVYLGKDDFYFEKILDSDILVKHYKNNIRYVDKVAKEIKSQVSILLVPSAGYVMTDKMPSHAVLYDAKRRYEEGKGLLFDGNWIEIADQLKEEKNSKQLYFRTDHHWTTQGAYEGYCTYMESMGEIPHSYESFSPECVSKSFYGTLYSKAPTNVKPDTLIIPENIPSCQVSCDGKKREGIYEWSKLKEKDKYAVYFGGNYGIVEIDNKESEIDKTLVMIKDSYANSMVPYLLPHYKRIVMLDLRYYNESVESLIEKENPDQLLILYEMSRFAKDSNLFKIMK